MKGSIKGECLRAAGLFCVLVLFACAPAVKPEKTAVRPYAWPEPPDEPRVRLVEGYKSSFDAAGEHSDMLAFLGEEGFTYLQRPHGIVADEEGSIYVSDIGYRVLKVYKFDFKKSKFSIIGDIGADKVILPLGLAVDNERKLLFVADGVGRKVVAFDRDSGDIKFIVGQGGTLLRPVAVAVDGKRQRIYVTDTKVHMVKAFDYEARELFSIGKGERSEAEDGFNSPADIAVDPEGNIYVTDTFNHAVKVFDQNGKLIKKIGRGLGMGFGNFSKVVGVALDSERHIYALDTDFGNFQIFDQDNNLLTYVAGSGGGDAGLLLPSGIFIDSRDRIYVTDTMQRMIKVYQYLRK